MPVKTKKAKTPVKELTGVRDLYHFLYKACDILRKFVEHESFKDYITPLLDYKRLSDVWDEEYEAALAESGNDEEYARLPEQHRFVIPKECHWEEVRERPENLGAAIVEALLMIEQANPDTLYGVLSVFPTDNFRDKNKLSDEVVRNLIEHLSSRKLGNKNYPADLMGDAYEILLKSFADESKAKGRVLFINAVGEVTRKNAESRLSPEHINKILEAYRARQSDGVFACDATAEEIAVNNFSLAISLYAHAASIRSSECGVRSLDDAIEEWNRAANQTVDALDDFKLLVEGR